MSGTDDLAGPVPLAQDSNSAERQTTQPMPLRLRIISALFMWLYPGTYRVQLSSFEDSTKPQELRDWEFDRWEECYHYDLLKHSLLSVFLIFAGMNTQFMLQGVDERPSAAADPIPEALRLMSIACAILGIACGEKLKRALSCVPSPSQSVPLIDLRDARDSVFDPSLVLALPPAWSIWGFVFLVMEHLSAAFYVPSYGEHALRCGLVDAWRMGLAIFITGGALYSCIAIAVFRRMSSSLRPHRARRTLPHPTK